MRVSVRQFWQGRMQCMRRRCFGARAYAKNFSKEQMLAAIDEAHLHGRKFYLTVNTLLKEPEMAELFAYLEPFYNGGLDAVIVQDLGVFSFVRRWFPDMEIHVSTQMTVTGSEGAVFLKERGATRVVPARELSLEEVRRIKRNRNGNRVLCARSALLLLFRSVSHEQSDRRKKRKPGAVRATVSASVWREWGKGIFVESERYLHA